jgi:hypothetical protein
MSSMYSKSRSNREIVVGTPIAVPKYNTRIFPCIIRFLAGNVWCWEAHGCSYQILGHGKVLLCQPVLGQIRGGLECLYEGTWHLFCVCCLPACCAMCYSLPVMSTLPAAFPLETLAIGPCICIPKLTGTPVLCILYALCLLSISLKGSSKIGAHMCWGVAVDLVPWRPDDCLSSAVLLAEIDWAGSPEAAPDV